MKNKRFKAFSVIGLVVLLLLGPLFLESYYLHLAIMVFIYVIVASSLRTVYISGQLSLGHAAFMAIGAYTSAVLAKTLHWSPWYTVPLGALASTAVAIGIGFPFSRLRAIYFSMASLFFGIMVTSSAGLAPGLTGGFNGLHAIPRLFGFVRMPYYYLFLVSTLLILLILYRVEHSRIGMTFKSVAQSHLAASSRGINEGGMRICASAIGAFFAGIAGGCYAHYVGFIAPAQFGVMTSILLIVYLITGGKGSFTGPIVGTVILYLTPYIMGGFQGYAPFFQAGVLIAVIFLLPEGMISLPGQLMSWLRKPGEGRRAAIDAP